MQNATGSRVILLAYSFSIALCSFVLLGAMLLSPSEASSAVFLGLSLVRLVLALGFLSAFLLSAAIFIKAVKDRGWAERTLEEWFGGGRFSRWLTWLVGIGLGLGWIGRLRCKDSLRAGDGLAMLPLSLPQKPPDTVGEVG